MELYSSGGVKIQKTDAEDNKDLENSTGNTKKAGKIENAEKIEICYTCGKKFDMNKDDGSRYRYGKFPLCAYCAEFYGFYFDDPGQKRKE